MCLQSFMHGKGLKKYIIIIVKKYAKNYRALVPLGQASMPFTFCAQALIMLKC